VYIKNYVILNDFIVKKIMFKHKFDEIVNSF